MAFEEFCYRDPSLAYEAVTARERKEAVKAERKAYRDRVGCKGCKRALGPVCGEGQTPHKGGFCKWWWDDRSPHEPTEIE